MKWKLQLDSVTLRPGRWYYIITHEEGEEEHCLIRLESIDFEYDSEFDFEIEIFGNAYHFSCEETEQTKVELEEDFCLMFASEHLSSIEEIGYRKGLRKIKTAQLISMI